MKKSLILISFTILLLAVVCFSGCLGPLSTSGGTNKTDKNVSEIYDLNVFIPVVSGHTKVVESGTYFTDSNSSGVMVVSVVDDKKEIRILKETGIFGLSNTRIKDVYFITNDNFSMTPSGIDETVSDPVILPLEYKLKESSKEAKLVLEENFSGILVYTTDPLFGGNSVYVNDNAQAVQIILSEKYETGNILFGKPSPKPDSIETDSNGQKIMKWNAPVGKVGVKYYQSSAPLYFTLAGLILLMLIALVLFRYKRQIRKLKQITHLSDPDSEEGFRNKNQKQK